MDADRADASARGELRTDHAKWRRRSKAARVRRRAEHEASIGARLTPVSRAFDREAIIRDRDAFLRWLAIDGPRQRQLKPRAGEIMRKRIVLLQGRIDLGRELRPAEFCRRLAACAYLDQEDTFQAARRQLGMLTALEGESGPWAAWREPELFTAGELAELSSGAGRVIHSRRG